jgi:transcriptional regulator with XRE-family HTH domain
MANKEFMIGLVLKTYKEEHGLTVRQLAGLLDEHYSTVWLWMSGKRQPNLRQVRKIREVTRVPYEHLLSEPPKEISH